MVAIGRWEPFDMSEAKASDARRSTRIAPASPVAVVDAMSGDVLGFVGDLSAGGMKLLAGKPLVDDALYQVQFQLDLPQRHASIEAGVQVVGQQKSPDGGSVVGMRFIHLQRLKAQSLQKWLQSRDVG